MKFKELNMADFEMTEAEFEQTLIECQHKTLNAVIRSLQKMQLNGPPEDEYGLQRAIWLIEGVIADLKEI
jgi:hypothetical protein